jgi:hypothetical protein
MKIRIFSILDRTLSLMAEISFPAAFRWFNPRQCNKTHLLEDWLS